MTTPDLVERLRGLASIALKAPMIAALSDAANEIERLSKTRAEIIEECAAWIAENGPALSTLAADALRCALSQEPSK